MERTGSDYAGYADSDFFTEGLSDKRSRGEGEVTRKVRACLHINVKACLDFMSVRPVRIPLLKGSRRKGSAAAVKESVVIE